MKNYPIITLGSQSRGGRASLTFSVERGIEHLGVEEFVLTTNVVDVQGQSVGGTATVSQRDDRWLHSVEMTRDGKPYGPLCEDHFTWGYDGAIEGAYGRLVKMARHILRVAAKHGGVYRPSPPRSQLSTG